MIWMIELLSIVKYFKLNNSGKAINPASSCHTNHSPGLAQEIGGRCLLRSKARASSERLYLSLIAF